MNKEEIISYCLERMAAYKVPDIVEIMGGACQKMLQEKY